MPAKNWLTRVYEGMEVYDSEGEKVGTVKQVFFGTSADAADAGSTRHNVAAPQTEMYRDDSIVDEMAEALVGAEEMPDELRERLLREGFIQLDRGLLRSDRFILAERVASVSDEGVRLNMSADELA